jgi:hypothetical protein
MEDAASEAGKPTAPLKLTVKELMADKRVMMGAGAAVVLILLLLVLAMKGKPKAKTVAQLEEKAVIMAGKAEDHHSVAGGTADKAARQVAGASEAEAKAAAELEESIAALQLPTLTNTTKTLIDHGRTGIAKDPDVAVNVIRSWLDEV